MSESVIAGNNENSSMKVMKNGDQEDGAVMADILANAIFKLVNDGIADVRAQCFAHTGEQLAAIYPFLAPAVMLNVEAYLQSKYGISCEWEGPCCVVSDFNGVRLTSIEVKDGSLSATSYREPSDDSQKERESAYEVLNANMAVTKVEEACDGQVVFIARIECAAIDESSVERFIDAYIEDLKVA